MESRDGARRGHVRTKDWTKVSHGLYRPSVNDAGIRDELAAWALVLPVSGAFTHLTAARAHGWWLPPMPVDLPGVRVYGDARVPAPSRGAQDFSAPASRLGTPALRTAFCDAGGDSSCLLPRSSPVGRGGARRCRAVHEELLLRGHLRPEHAAQAGRSHAAECAASGGRSL